MNDNSHSGSEHSDDDIINNVDDLEHSEVEEASHANNDGDEADNDGDRGETENNDESRKVEPKKRRVLNPQPKLNEERLKGPRGIGVIEKMFEDVKLKGKDHEKEDLDLVMARLEHWAHRLFPKFQFDDCLQKIEKLGSKRPIVTYVKNLRMGMEDQIINEIIEPPSPPMPSVDPFDELIGRQQDPPPQTAKKPVTLTAEQRERMLRNRLLAEERRMARLQAQKEKVAQGKQNIIDKEGNSVTSQNTSEGEQMDVSKNSREELSENSIEASDNLDRIVSKDLEIIYPVADTVNTEVLESPNQEVQILDTVDKQLEEDSSGDKTNIVSDRNVKGAISETVIISDHDSRTTKVIEMNTSIITMTE